MLRRVVGVVLFVALVIGTATMGTAQKLHPKLKKQEKVVKTILLVPPMISITKDTVKGGEGMLKESEMIETASRKLVIDALRAKGITVIDAELAPEALSKNEELKYVLADVQSKYDQMHLKVLGKRNDVEKGRFTLGDQVGKVTTTKEVDALVFVRGNGVVVTAGKAFLGALAGGRSGSSLFLTIGIVDIQTGDVLYFDQRSVVSGAWIGKKFHEKPEEALKKPVDKALNKLPVPAQNAKTKA